MRKPPGLTIDVSTPIKVNNSSLNKNTSNNHGIYTVSSTKSISTTIFREEGLSIGRDYMRMEGVTIFSKKSFPSLNDLIIRQTLGKGISSIVQLATTTKGCCKNLAANSNHNSNDDHECYALKIFPLFKEANQSRIISTYDAHSQNLKSKKQSSMLTREIKILSKIQCDCIIQFKGAFYNPLNDNVTMVLEYMDYGSLHDYLFSNKIGETQSNNNTDTRWLPENALSSISYQILYGLSYLHHEKILHRDIKPQNILLNSKGQVKISDLGISSCKNYVYDTTDKENHDNYDENGESGLNHTVIGTSCYMSPERVFDKAYSCPSDLWSFGLVLLEFTTGGWNPMRDGDYVGIDLDDNNEKENQDGKTGKERMSKKIMRSRRNNVTSMIELAMILEDFCIYGIFEMLDAIYCKKKKKAMKGSRGSCVINWEKEKKKKNGFGELVIFSLQKEPGECNSQ